jgi:adenylate cyclase
MNPRNRLILTVSVLLLAAIGGTVAALDWNARRSVLEQTRASGLQVAEQLARAARFAEDLPRDVESVLGEQMIVEASIAARFVEAAEKAGWSAGEINQRLQQITKETVLDEFWITDETGNAYLRNKVEIPFRFDPDPAKQPQAHIFWPLLEGRTKSVVQGAMRREVDDQTFKYVAVGGVDKPRIVQVGYNARILRKFEQDLGLSKLASTLAGMEHVDSIHVVDLDLKTLAFAARRKSDAPKKAVGLAAEAFKNVFKENQAQSDFDEDFLRVYAPIQNEKGQTFAGALVALRTDALDDQLQRNHLVALVVAAVALVIGLTTTLWLARSLFPA